MVRRNFIACGGKSSDPVSNAASASASDDRASVVSRCSSYVLSFYACVISQHNSGKLDCCIMRAAQLPAPHPNRLEWHNLTKHNYGASHYHAQQSHEYMVIYLQM